MNFPDLIVSRTDQDSLTLAELIIQLISIEDRFKGNQLDEESREYTELVQASLEASKILRTEPWNIPIALQSAICSRPKIWLQEIVTWRRKREYRINRGPRR